MAEEHPKILALKNGPFKVEKLSRLTNHDGEEVETGEGGPERPAIPVLATRPTKKEPSMTQPTGKFHKGQSEIMPDKDIPIQVTKPVSRVDIPGVNGEAVKRSKIEERK